MSEPKPDAGTPDRLGDMTGFPINPRVKPPRLRCYECGRFVSARGVEVGYIEEGIEDGFVCPRCNIENEPLDDSLEY